MHHWLQAAADARVAAETHAVTYIDFLTVTLTAVCALLAALAIIIAIAAIWGYIGIKDEITKVVTRRAEEALEKKLGEYPDSKDMFLLFENMKKLHDRQIALSSQLVTSSAPRGGAKPSKKKADNKVETFAKDYPGEGGG